MDSPKFVLKDEEIIKEDDTLKNALGSLFRGVLMIGGTAFAVKYGISPTVVGNVVNEVAPILAGTVFAGGAFLYSVGRHFFIKKSGG